MGCAASIAGGAVLLSCWSMCSALWWAAQEQFSAALGQTSQDVGAKSGAGYAPLDGYRCVGDCPSVAGRILLVHVRVPFVSQGAVPAKPLHVDWGVFASAADLTRRHCIIICQRCSVRFWQGTTNSPSGGSS